MTDKKPLFRFDQLFAAAMTVAQVAALPASVDAAEGEGHEQHQHHARQHDMSGGDDPHAHHRAKLNKPEEPAQTTRVVLRDLDLINQDGEKVKFVSDVTRDRIVVMSFVYTTCTTACPIITAIFEQVQKKLGDALGDEVVMISASIDPARDTPQRLKTYASKHNAGPDWIWLTGNKRTMDDVLDGLGAYTTNYADHPTMVLIGDSRSGKWSRFFGFPNPDRLVEKVDAYRSARREAAGA